MTSGGSCPRLVRAGLAVGFFFILLSPRPGAAEVEGPCSASLNGVEVERIDSLGSPLELTVDDALTFHGTDPMGTQNVSVSLILASLTIDRGVSTYGPEQDEFAASIDLEEVSPYGVGLFRVRGTTDNCAVAAWVRVGGKVPLTTLTGVTGLGLALGGLTGQVAAIAARRRMAWLMASLAGIATGFGGALLGQQYGRLQLSYISIAIIIGVAVGAGALVAILFQLREGPTWAERRRTEQDPRREPREDEQLQKAELRQQRDEQQARAAAGRELRDRTVATSARVSEPPAPTIQRAEPQEGAATAPQPAARPEGPYWCYVLSQVEVLDLTQPTRVIAVLQPGSWYLARREAGEWVHVVAGEGVEGWAARNSIHRHG